jgi:hypothetical protein
MSARENLAGAFFNLHAVATDLWPIKVSRGSSACRLKFRKSARMEGRALPANSPQGRS